MSKISNIITCSYIQDCLYKLNARLNCNLVPFFDRCMLYQEHGKGFSGFFLNQKMCVRIKMKSQKNTTLLKQFQNQILKSCKEAKSILLLHKYRTIHCPDWYRHFSTKIAELKTISKFDRISIL